MSRDYLQSRINQIEKKKDKKQAMIFVGLSVVFLILLLVLGSTMLIKGAVFFADMKGSSAKIEDANKIPPMAPRLLPIVEATNSATIAVTGFSEPGVSIQVVVNEKDLEQIITDDKGKFSIPKLLLPNKGTNDIFAYALDKDGTKSRPSKTYTIIYDNEKPKLKISHPANNATFFDEQREIIVGGETDTDATVKVNGFLVVVDNEGNFAKKYQLLEGDNEIVVTATDAAGNINKQTLKVKYQK